MPLCLLWCKNFTTKQCLFICNQFVETVFECIIWNKEVSCISCGHQCSIRAVFKWHPRSHTGEIPLKCRLCVYQGLSKAILKTHPSFHIGEKAILRVSYLYCNGHNVHLCLFLLYVYFINVNNMEYMILRVFFYFLLLFMEMEMDKMDTIRDLLRKITF